MARNDRYTAFERGGFDTLSGLPAHHFPWLLVDEWVSVSPGDVWQIQVTCTKVEPTPTSSQWVKAHFQVVAKQPCSDELFAQFGVNGPRLRVLEPRTFELIDHVQWSTECALKDLAGKARALLPVFSKALKKKFTTDRKKEWVQERVSTLRTSRFSEED